jgi:hypothetical protein
LEFAVAKHWNRQQHIARQKEHNADNLGGMIATSPDQLRSEQRSAAKADHLHRYGGAHHPALFIEIADCTKYDGESKVPEEIEAAHRNQKNRQAGLPHHQRNAGCT